MAIQIHNFLDNDDIAVLKSVGSIDILEYRRDLSVDIASAQAAYFASQMNVRRRQGLIRLNNSAVTVQAGAMQWCTGDISLESNVQGAGDLLGKMFRGAVTGESAVKPVYRGTGYLALEPTFRHLLAFKLEEWNGSVVLEDGMFLACEQNVQQHLVARSGLSSAVAGGEGLFNLALSGTGTVLCESAVPEAELIAVDLHDDVLKVDGPLAIAWSGSLQFSVEKSAKGLFSSAASGEGLVNVYRGTGRVLMAPVA